ncbi:type IV secretion system protein [Microvirga tunisiensis]|uniref:Type IV secretion system protein n=1 Tax=Microvirga tunisiensis TaxID=2108360 RepID=A0A5N7MJ06_9HYPH|nr:type IV secretion system protein [Microvirga tunisiensis]MPR08858.1 type IV secretion system protein [Microvirga tunisiensis]MPR27041.1 type IV secretion system protein [Microvirga tunisiensis]
MNNVIGALFNKVDSLGMSAVQAIYNQLATALQPVFLLAMAIIVAFWGYEMLIGRVGLSAPVFLWRIGRMMLIYTLAVSWGDFQVLVAQVLTQAPDSLGNVVCQAVGGGSTCGNGGGSIASGLSNLWNAANSAAQKISAAAGWANFGMTILSYIVLLVAAVFVAIAAFLILMGKIALFVLLGLAPIFIAFALFGISIPFFDGWLRSCAQYAIIPLVVYGLLGFYIVLLDTVVNDMSAAVSSGEPTLTVIAPFILMCVIGWFIAYHCLGIAQGIAGGARLSTNGLDGTAKHGALAAAVLGGKGLLLTGIKAGQAYRYLRGHHSNQIGPSHLEKQQALITSALDKNRS